VKLTVLRAYSSLSKLSFVPAEQSFVNVMLSKAWQKFNFLDSFDTTLTRLTTKGRHLCKRIQWWCDWSLNKISEISTFWNCFVWMTRQLVRAKYSVIHSLLDMTKLKMKHESRVVKDVMQCAKRLETSIETHEVLVIRIYFSSTSTLPFIIALTIFNMRQAKPKGKYFNFLRKKYTGLLSSTNHATDDDAKLRFYLTGSKERNH